MAKKSEEEQKNDNRTVITAIAILVALAAVTYALVTGGNRPESAALNDVAEVEIAETSYEQDSDNPVVLEIDGDTVTRQEIIDNFEASNSTVPPSADMQQIFPLLQDQYIIGYLLEQAAREAGITQDDPQVRQRVSQALDQALRAVYIQKIGEEAVTDNDLRQAYQDIVGSAPDMEERRARHILVQSEEEARELIAELDAGADFEALAREHSIAPEGENGGDLGYFVEQEMVGPFAEAVFDMEVGSISEEPVQTQFGWHVIQVVDSRTREKPTMEEVRPQLEQQLRQAVIGAKLQELRQQADITVYSYGGEEITMPAGGGTAVPPMGMAPAPAAVPPSSAPAPAPTPVAPPAP